MDAFFLCEKIFSQCVYVLKEPLRLLLTVKNIDVILRIEQ